MFTFVAYWPNGDLSVGMAKNEVELVDILDEAGDPYSAKVFRLKAGESVEIRALDETNVDLWEGYHVKMQVNEESERLIERLNDKFRQEEVENMMDDESEDIPLPGVMNFFGSVDACWLCQSNLGLSECECGHLKKK